MYVYKVCINAYNYFIPFYLIFTMSSIARNIIFVGVVIAGVIQLFDVSQRSLEHIPVNHNQLVCNVKVFLIIILLLNLII